MLYFQINNYRLQVWDPDNPSRKEHIAVGQSGRISFRAKKVPTVNWVCDGMTKGWFSKKKLDIQQTTLGGDTRTWNVSFNTTEIRGDSRSFCGLGFPVTTGTIVWKTGATVTDPDISKENLSTLITKKDE